MEYDPELLAHVLVSKKGEEAFLTEIRSTTTSINHHLPQKVDFNRLKELVLKSFEDHLGITLTKGQLSDDECQLKDLLLKEKYATDQWNLHRHK